MLAVNVYQPFTEFPQRLGGLRNALDVIAGAAIAGDDSPQMAFPLAVQVAICQPGADSGQGIEIVSGSHSNDNVLHFARLARHYAFHASRGSDFHGPEESYVDLGRLPPLPEDLKPVWRLVG